MQERLWVVVVLAALASAACTEGTSRPPREERDSGPVVDGEFMCLSASSEACVGNFHFTCTRDGEFLRPVREDCTEQGKVCVDQLWCVVCPPNAGGCNADGDAIICREDGSGWDVVDDCDAAEGEVCDVGVCRNPCDVARENRSYVGCEFFGVDLDNAAIGAGRDAAAQQYAIVVSNPGFSPADVEIEIDLGPFGGETRTRVVAAQTVLPGDLEVFELDRREVDGASSFMPCAADDECSSASQQCWCRDGLRPGAEGATDCRCRSSSRGSGLNDGTHSAVTAHAYRIRSSAPIIAYQFNPFENFGVFSNDASLLLPTTGVGVRYTVIGWPQTIANSSNPEEDFDPSRSDEDLRAFLTIVGTRPDTELRITLGPSVRSVEPLPGDAGRYGPGDVIELRMGELDVVNLETQGFNADFTGTEIVANPGHPVIVFSGSEASDAPYFELLANRQCCADHLEEQLFSNEVLGRRFFVGLTPARSPALNAAFLTNDTVGEFAEPESVRILAVNDGTTFVETTLDDGMGGVRTWELAKGQSAIIETTTDFAINASQAVAVMQIMSSQDAVGIPSDYPGGDPSTIVLPPIEQYRQDYVFLTPDRYAFDFITITAPAIASILLDELPLSEFDCSSAPADGIVRGPSDPPAEWLVYRCQLSFPDVIGRPNVLVQDGSQDDGYHTIRATHEVGVVVSGFDLFVSYAYAAGADLDAIN